MKPLTELRRDFPILDTTVHGRPLVYLDNAATFQMPAPVLETIQLHYLTGNANVHRGVHRLSQLSTDAMEHARAVTAEFLGAAYPEEVIFTSGTTDSINLLATALARSSLKPGDVVLTTELEHHSNLVPWQEACRRSGATLKVVPVTDRCDLDLDRLAELLTPQVRLLAVTRVSNVTGTVNPIPQICEMAHKAGAQVLVDCAQGMKMGPVNVSELGCDYLAFSGHKLGALTGIGVLWGRKELLAQLPPVSFGGGMIDTVELDRSTWGELPLRLEAGTPNYVGAISLGAALEYLRSQGPDAIAEQEDILTRKTVEVLSAFPAVRILGDPAQRSGAVSFTVDGASCLDVGMLLDAQGIAVRTGHLCAMPLLTRFGLSHVIRVSPAFYNTEQELDCLSKALSRVLTLLHLN